MPRPSWQSPTPAARAQALIADLSSHLIAITTGFTGTEVLLFGALEEPGDVVVIVRGPVSDAAVRRKDRIAGIWVNSERLDFRDVPSYYAVASSQPLSQIGQAALLARHGIGLDFLRLTPAEEVSEAGMQPSDIVSMTTYVVAGQGLAEVMAARDHFLSPHLAASTLVTVPALASPEWLVEVAVIAAA